VRLLISARDTGSAHEAAAFVQSAVAARLPFEFTMVGYGPAVPVLESTGLPVTCWPHAPRRASAAARRSAADLVDTARPDALLVGLAYPGFGPDEALNAVARSRGLPTAAIQDYWGHVGGFTGEDAPDTFFVIDTLAARLTRLKLGPNVRVVVTGSPRRLKRSAISPPRPRARDRGGPALVCYFGQPASFPGCAENLTLFVEAVAKLPRPIRLRFRRHPGDSSSMKRYADLLATQPHPWEFSMPERAVEDDLIDADLIVTCHSSVGLDHHYLQLRTAAPLAPVLFVTVGAPVRRFLHAQVGIPEVPNVRLGFAAGVTQARDLAPTLLRLLDDPDVAATYRKRVVRRLTTRQEPCGIVANYFLSR